MIGTGGVTPYSSVGKILRSSKQDSWIIRTI